MSVQLTLEDRTELARALMTIFDAWKINAEDRIALLGLPDKTRSRILIRYRNGDEALPEKKDILKRAEVFLSINNALRTTFPHNPAMGSLWVTTNNRWFNNNTPLSVMLDEGMDGIYKIYRHLDCTQNWF